MNKNETTLTATFTDIVRLLKNPDTDWNYIWKTYGKTGKVKYEDIIVEYMKTCGKNVVKREKIREYIEYITYKDVSNQFINRYLKNLVDKQILIKKRRGLYKLNHKKLSDSEMGYKFK